MIIFFTHFLLVLHLAQYVGVSAHPIPLSKDLNKRGIHIDDSGPFVQVNLTYTYPYLATDEEVIKESENTSDSKRFIVPTPTPEDRITNHLKNNKYQNPSDNLNLSGFDRVDEETAPRISVDSDMLKIETYVIPYLKYQTIHETYWKQGILDFGIDSNPSDDGSESSSSSGEDLDSVYSEHEEEENPHFLNKNSRSVKYKEPGNWKDCALDWLKKKLSRKRDGKLPEGTEIGLHNGEINGSWDGREDHGDENTLFKCMRRVGTLIKVLFGSICKKIASIKERSINRNPFMKKGS